MKVGIDSENNNIYISISSGNMSVVNSMTAERALLVAETLKQNAEILLSYNEETKPGDESGAQSTRE